MKILLLIDSLGPGGAQNQLVLLAKTLKAKGHLVHVFYYHDINFFKDRLSEGDIKVFLCQKKNKLGLNVIHELNKLDKTYGYDGIISFLDTPNFYASVLSALKKERLKIVASYRSKTEIGTLPFLKKIQYHFINKNSTYLVSNSIHERLNWVNTNPVLAKKFYTIYNGIEFDSVKEKKSYNSIKRIMMVGKLRPLKNAQLVLSMLENNKVDGIEIHWFGGTEFNNDKMNSHAEKCKSRAKRLKIKWIFHQSTPKIKEKYADFDLLLHPSLWEGLPNVVCEAMSAGLPVLISNILDHPHLVNHHKDLLFNPDDVYDLYQKLNNLLGLRPSQLQDIGLTLRARAKNLFNPDQMSKKYLTLISGEAS
ncbi:glycosyltransferase family 4 protein [Portibacter marinus]|uniref:glycosyltransferase family 4 protein n=1 Tax=Portibacter marinus TaxID=2898660 RepID=UPI001F29380C|nr:glycosyltransferase family 4 protein [Portibacter marinus]